MAKGKIIIEIISRNIETIFQSAKEFALAGLDQVIILKKCLQLS